jgi:probable F420-dependent oxidoreductase
MSGFDLGRVGIWTRELDRLPMAAARAAARDLEDLGYRTLWLPEVIGREPLTNAALILAGTRQLIVGTGVANIYARSATAMQAGWRTLTEAFPDRFVLGVGVSQPAIVEQLHGRVYEPPFTRMTAYLDAMEGGVFVAAKPTTERRLVLAALRPRFLTLAAERAFGSIGYFVPVTHTAWARQLVGPDARLLIEQAVVLEANASAAREIARRYMATYLALPLYTDHLRDLGWSTADVVDPPDSRVDEIVAWGSPGDIAERVRAHVHAGADHVALQVVSGDPRIVPVDAWRTLADAVLAV